MEFDSDKRYHTSLKIAKFGFFVSVLTLIGIAVICPLMIYQSNKTLNEIETMSKKFKV